MKFQASYSLDLSGSALRLFSFKFLLDTILNELILCQFSMKSCIKGSNMQSIVAWSVACQLCKWSQDRPSHHTPSIVEIFPSSTDSRRASCHLLVKEWALNTGNLSQGGMAGMPRNSVVK